MRQRLPLNLKAPDWLLELRRAVHASGPAVLLRSLRADSVLVNKPAGLLLCVAVREIRQSCVAGFVARRLS